MMAFAALCINAQAVELQTNYNYIVQDDVVDNPDVLPKFPGGMKAMTTFIAKNVNYPKEAAAKNVEGKVIVQFIVKKDGSVTDAKVISKTDNILNKEALRVVNTMPKWKPGKNKGKVVDVRFVLPIAFKLPRVL